MRWAYRRFDAPNTVAATALLVVTTFLGGCTTPLRSAAAAPSSASAAQPTSPAFVSYGRYGLKALGPEVSQQDLMLQIIDITMPATMAPTVGEALRYVLLRSGYQLCEDREETHALQALPLPAVHLHLGPLTLREALQVLVGAAWRLEIDDVARRVCFSTQPGVAHKASSSDAGPALNNAARATALPTSSRSDQQP